MAVGAAVVAVERDDARISATRIDHLLPPRGIGLLWHRDRYHSTAFAAFVRVARAVCADLSAQAEAR